MTNWMGGGTVRLLGGYLLLIALTMLLAGCWDRAEIQERNFVMAVAIDVAEAPGSQGKPGTRLESFDEGGKNLPRYRLSLQILRLAESKGGEKAGESKTYVISDTGGSFFAMVRDMLGQSSKTLWFENMQAIIISEAAVRQAGMDRLVDFWRRDAEMRWRASVFITSGEARSILEYIPPSGQPGGQYISNVARRQIKDPELATARTDLLYLMQALDAAQDFALPRLELEGPVLKIKGAGIFKRGQFITYLDEYAVKGGRMIRGTEKAGVITAECPVHPGNYLVFELFRHDTRLKPHVEGDKIYFTLDIAMRGNLGEVSCQAEHDTKSSEYLRAAQALFAEEVKRNVLYTYQLQQKNGVDVVGLGGCLRAYEPATWARVKDHWDDVCRTVPLEVSVNVSVVNVGEHQ
ncbi:MAG: Ger(x)C family spore germination protein [Negativicutes bacterium]|nr:Ger(x)C family spore germination protein [Negativicutes bacterium]